MPRSTIFAWALFFFAVVVQTAHARKFLVRDEPAVKSVLPFYHTSDELHSKLQEAVSNCRIGKASLETDFAGLDVIRISSQQESSGNRPSALFVYGEHARELFSAESGVHFVRTLCGLENLMSEDKIRNSLDHFDFVIVPNANPQGRRMVEAGNYCKRTNENGVDLNRNYGGLHRDAASEEEYKNDVSSGADQDDQGKASDITTNPGPHGFSEPESQAIREIAVNQPLLTLYLSIHTGAYVLGMPFGYTDSKEPPHADEMRSILADISQMHCGGNCPYGSLASVVHYESKGSSVDYVAEELHVPFTFTWEIYKHSSDFASDAAESLLHNVANDDAEPKADGANSITGASKTNDAMVALQQDVSQGRQAVNPGAAVVSSPLNTAETKEEHRAKHDRSCLEQFNPLDESTFTNALENWSAAYLDLAGKVAGAGSTKPQQDATQGLAAGASDEASSTQSLAVKGKKATMLGVATAVQPPLDTPNMQDELKRWSMR